MSRRFGAGENVKSFVVDTSVVVKWFVSEPDSVQALELREDFVQMRTGLVVPSLLRYEVLNALRYSGGFGTAELARIASTLEDYQFTEVPLNGKYAAETVQIAMDTGLTIYDASFLAIAEVRGIEFYTADDKVLEKVKALQFARHLRRYRRIASPQ